MEPTQETIALCCDHAGFEMMQEVISILQSRGIAYQNFGTFSQESCDYADFAHPAAQAVEEGICHRGIAICGSGNGINMTLNKHQGIRAALCWEKELAYMARIHNNANFLVMPGRYVSKEQVKQMVQTYLNTDFEEGRHLQRIAKIPLKKGKIG